MEKLIGRALTPVAALVVAALCPWSSAVAESNPLSLSISQNLSFDNNFLRRSGGGPSDTTSLTAATVAYNKAYGRQNYGASLTANATRHNRFKDYDNDGYAVALGMTSTVGSKGYLALQHSSSRSLQSPDEQTGQRYADTITSHATSLYGQYGLYGRLGVNSTVSATKSQYSLNKANDSDQMGLRVGVNYSPNELLSFGAGVRKSERKLENAGDKINRYDYDLNTNWVVTGYSRLSASVALTDEKRVVNEGLDYRGVTGSLRWGYTPGGKMSYGLSISRDTTNSGQGNGTFLVTNDDNSVVGAIRNQSQNQLTTTLSATANWAATSKIGVGVGLNYSRFTDSREAEIIGAISGLESQFLPSDGRQYGASISVSYTPVRSTRLGCTLQAYKRDQTRLNVSGYRGETLGCDATFSIE